MAPIHRSSINIIVSANYGYVIGTALFMYFGQTIGCAVPVVMWRNKTGIKAPLMDPTDADIKRLKISDADLNHYRCVQRGHLNNVEFQSHFLPLFLIAGAFPENTLKVAYAGVALTCIRMFGALGYPYGVRKFSGVFHFAEWYILYLLGASAVAMTK